MENLSNAIFMAFTMIALIIGLSFGIYLINDLNSVAAVLIESNDHTQDYQSISYDSSQIEKTGKGNAEGRIVSSEIVISSLYRYYLEDFSVELYYDKNDLEIPSQLFDLDIEQKLNSKNENNPLYRVYNKLYGQNSTCNLFGAPWMTDISNKEYNKQYTKHRYVKQRVDMFVNSSKGYINGTLVDYSNNGLKNYLEDSFKEEFIQYTFDGETISADDEGEEIDTIVGSRRAQTKIIIRYIKQ